MLSIPVRKLIFKRPTELTALTATGEHCAQNPEKVKDRVKLFEMKTEEKLPTPKEKPPRIKVLTLEKIRKMKMKNSGSLNKKLKPKNSPGGNPKTKVDLEDQVMLPVLDKGGKTTPVRNLINLNLKKNMTKHDSPYRGKFIKKVVVNPKTEKIFCQT